MNSGSVEESLDRHGGPTPWLCGSACAAGLSFPRHRRNSGRLSRQTLRTPLKHTLSWQRGRAFHYYRSGAGLRYREVGGRHSLLALVGGHRAGITYGDPVEEVAAARYTAGRLARQFGPGHILPNLRPHQVNLIPIAKQVQGESVTMCPSSAIRDTPLTAGKPGADVR